MNISVHNKVVNISFIFIISWEFDKALLIFKCAIDTQLISFHAILVTQFVTL